MDGFNLKRPKRVSEEDEDDLLAFQEQFLKSRVDQPAAKVVKVSQNEEPVKKENVVEKKSQMVIDFDHDNKALETVLSEIVERPIKKDVVSLDQPVVVKSGMPEVEKLNIKELKKNSTRNKSLFAQNLERQGKLKSHYELSKIQQVESLKQNDEIKKVEQHLKVNKQTITGQGLNSDKEAEKIHLENLQVLSRMTDQEILAEQQKLLNQLDPKIVAFIRRKTNQTENQNGSQQDIKTGDKKYNKEEFLEQLPFKPNKNWLNMDKIEYEKLEWMIKPPPSNLVNGEDGSQSYSARFDFEGNVVPPDQDVPVTKALHHHGNEPDKAGYTLDELFTLARSKFSQQKVLALQTIGNILAQCHKGTYHEIIKSSNPDDLTADDDETDEYRNDRNNLLNQLVDGGVLFLLRVSLDDQTESIINASLNGIRNLIQPVGQEDLLDYAFDTNAIIEMPSLHPFSKIFYEKPQKLQLDKNINVSERRELNELKDDEFIRHDLIRGLVRMNLIERIYYLLDKYRPTLTLEPVLDNVFAILFRCMRHSAEFCVNFYEKFTNLIDLIVKNFLPNSVGQLNDENLAISRLKQQSACHSLKLLRLIACSGSTVASKLFQKYDLKTKFLSYMTTEEFTAHDLKREVVRTLKVFVSYSNNTNEHYGVNSLVDLYEILVKKLTRLADNDRDLMLSIITLFNLLLLRSYESNTQNISSNVFSMLASYINDQFKKLLESSKSDFEFDLVSVAMNYCSDYLERVNTGADQIQTNLDSVESFIKNIYKPVLEDKQALLKFDSLIMSKLGSLSVNSPDSEPSLLFRKIHSNNLTYLPTILGLSQTSSMAGFSFIGSYTRMLLICYRLRMKLLDTGCVKSFLSNPYFKSYMKMFTNKPSSQEVSAANVYFNNKLECMFVYHFLRLTFHIYNFQDNEDHQTVNEQDKRFHYTIALGLLIRLKRGDELLAHDIFVNLLFNSNFWSTILSSSSSSCPDSFLSRYLEKLSISDNIEFNYMNANVGQCETINVNKSVIDKLESDQIYQSLPQIKLTYLSHGYVLSESDLENSRRLRCVSSKQILTLFTSHLYSNQFLLKPDWIYRPILDELVKHEKKLNRNPQDPTQLTSTISSTLKYIYLLEMYFDQSYLNHYLSVTLRYARLMCVYLFDSDVFLDKQVVIFLFLIYLKYSKEKTKTCALESLDLKSKLDGFLSFYDFYQHLLTQYDSSSFGDYLFSLYMIVPLQQRYPVKFRQLFWSDYPHLFKFMRFNTKESSLLLPLSDFVEPNEKSLHMIRLYSQVLLDPTEYQLVSQSKLAYTILIASLNSFIFEHVNQVERQIEFDFKRLLVKQFFSLNNEKLKHDLLNYKSINSEKNEMEFFDELPSMRKDWLNRLQSS